MKVCMLAKKTSKNQITIPKAIIAAYEGIEYFDVSSENGRIILQPHNPGQADAVRDKLHSLGIKEADIQYAIDNARSKSG
jgi:bifunctional DNA-binding transcriptional regulator/antitoxin component of YhaV-PrlF toxin-antitoxin module